MAILTNIIQLNEESGRVFYPQTHEKAVIDSNGNTLDTKIAGTLKYTEQSLTAAQQGQARTNIAAAAESALAALETAISAKYSKPASGIPETDLNSSVQSALALARTSIQSLAEYYNKTEIDALLSAVNSEQYVDVTTLPTASASTLGKIYLVGPDSNGVYTRHYTSYDGSTYSWVSVGTTEINLANYATKAELDQLGQEQVMPLSKTVFGFVLTSGSHTGTDIAWFTIPNALENDTQAKISISGNLSTIGSVNFISSDYGQLGTADVTNYSEFDVVIPAGTKYIQVKPATGQTLDIVLSASAVGLVDMLSSTNDDLSYLKKYVFGDAETVVGNGDATLVNDEKLKSGNVLNMSLVSNTGSKINCYGYYGSGQSEVIASLTNAGDSVSITLSRNYTSLFFYQGTAGDFEIVVGNVGISPQIDEIESNISDIKDEIEGVDESINGITLTGNGGARFDSESLVAGAQFSMELISNSGSALNVFAYINSTEYEAWGPLVGSVTKKLDKNYSFIFFYQGTAGDFSVRVGVNTIDGRISKNADDIASLQNVPVVRALILGDSYSERGGQWCNPMIQELPEGSSFISLAVSGATLRDRYADRVTYPYSSRPVPTGEGNNNTLASQIEKLKRLMAGTDLDSGESQIYATEDSYPNVIIIQGGHNDHEDSDAVEATYFSQFNKEMTNVYQRMDSANPVSIGTCYIKTPISEVDRTCFAGAYRYLLEELVAIFPNAQFFFASCSMIGYWNTPIVERRYKTVEQQRKCATICSATLIDWAKDASINVITNYPSGSGTEQDPYVWGEAVTNPAQDSGDCLHPNERGGKKLGHLSALVIRQHFLSIIPN